MPRIRTVKPELAKHEGLFDLESETGLPIRYAWALLPCFCDREGRFEWRERRLNAEIFPYDTEPLMARVLDALVTRGFLVKYRVGRAWYGWIPTFTDHQVINNRESASEIPDPATSDEAVYFGDHELTLPESTRDARVDHARGTPLVHAQAEGKGREGKGRDKEPDGSSPEAKKPPARFVIPLTNGKCVEVSQSDIDRYCELFPAVDVEQSIRNMLAWLDSNPQKRSGSARGAKTRMTSWLSRDQDKASRQRQELRPNESPSERAAREAMEWRERRMAGGGA